MAGTRRSRAASPAPGPATGHAPSWQGVRDEVRARGMRWTPQRRLILDVLATTSGHVTGSDLVERCRARDPETTPSTVYRTLDVLEELGYLRHSHSATGREEFHVMPRTEHAHLQCRGCDSTWEIEASDARRLLAPVRTQFGFAGDVEHLTIVGLCASCQQPDAPAPGGDVPG